MRTTIRAAVVGIAVLASLALAGCSSGSETSGSAATSGSDGSRVKLYSSLPELSADSAVIASGTVTNQRTAADIDSVTEFTISTMSVSAVVKGSGLASGSTLEVRQIGSAKHPGPAPLMTVGSTYLLYLTPSGLSGPLASQYYVTGGTAGLYIAGSSGVAARSSGSFSHINSDEGDRLPADVTLAGAAG
jgi:hypothetical protein